jgi:hypothetical protein
VSSEPGAGHLEVFASGEICKPCKWSNNGKFKMSSEENRRKEIEALKKVEQEAFGPRHGKFDFYKFLELVWRLYREWKAAGKSKRRARQVARLYKIKLRKSTHPIRVIIDASSERRSDVKSRWTRALQFVDQNRSQVEEAGFREFMEGNGGPSGCAGMIAKDKPQKKPKARP